MGVGWDEGISGIGILKKKPSGVAPRGFNNHDGPFLRADVLSTRYGPPTEIQKASISTPSEKYPRALTEVPWVMTLSVKV